MSKDKIAKAISVAEAKSLFADWKNASAVVLAVSGGPDSVALMWLAARWRAAMKKGPRLIAVTVDHDLRDESAKEARDVKRLAASVAVEHRTLRWVGKKPKTGIPAAARDARYRLLADAARSARASHIFTAHTRNDQAETFIMRLSRGSGIGGLASMARQSARDGIILARPLLDVSKAQLIATLKKANIDFTDDPTNRDTRFMRPRLRELMPALEVEGADARSLARAAARMARANAALEKMADGAERYLSKLEEMNRVGGFSFAAFLAMSPEIRIRLLLRFIDRAGHEGPAELGKVEAVLEQIDRAYLDANRKYDSVRFKRTLAGAVISISRNRVEIEPAPRRRTRLGRK
ncbi:MAG: tRNA lysidine(34) synthetase TilS [Afipia sp.]|nr:tRNA lysidine(34) synthetase TilS [Afipia sp.]